MSGDQFTSAPAASPAEDAPPAPRELLRRDALDPGVDYVPPADLDQARLAEILQHVLGVDRVGINDSFFELGGDSLQAIDLFLRVEKTFNVLLSPSVIIDHPTVATLAALIGDHSGDDARSCLVSIEPEGIEPALFLIHEASGNLFSYRYLVHRLGTGRKIFGISYPGQDQDPIPRLSLPQMAAVYVDLIKRAQPKGPYYLLGFSFGGTAAYEVAYQLRLRGEDVGLLVVVDSEHGGSFVRGAQRAVRKLSQHLENLSEQRPASWIRYVMTALGKEITHRLGRAPPPVPPFGAEFDAMRDVELPERLRALEHVVPARVHELMSTTLMSALHDYSPPFCDGPIKVMRCTSGIGARWALRDRGWGKFARGGIQVVDIPTHHYAALTEPTVALVAAQLAIWLKQADRDHPRA